MKLASIEIVKDIHPHHNADALEIADVLGYQCIVQKGTFNPNDLVVFIQPDTVLPDKSWSEMFKKRSSRVKAIKLRGVWSFGIVMSPATVIDDASLLKSLVCYDNVGKDISDVIGVYKYEPPTPQDLSAEGYLPTGLPKTDEERYQNLLDELPFGVECDVTLKIDGSSATYFCRNIDGKWETAICSRSLILKKESSNNYTKIAAKYNIIENLEQYCKDNNVNLALRGEIYGQGIQVHNNNPHSKGPIDFAAFNVYNMDTFSYEQIDSEHYYTKVCDKLGIPTVPTLEHTTLTKELIQKYSADLSKINGNSFEGVVVKYKGGSFKIINLAYDEKK